MPRARQKINGPSLFILTRIGYEYNDEVMYRPESQGGEPVKAYRSAEEAQKAADAANLKEYLSQDMSTYGYSADEVFRDVDVATDMLKAEGYEGSLEDGFHDGDGLKETLRKMPPKAREKFCANFRIKFFEVTEIEFSDK